MAVLRYGQHDGKVCHSYPRSFSSRGGASAKNHLMEAAGLTDRDAGIQLFQPWGYTDW